MKAQPNEINFTKKTIESLPVPKKNRERYLDARVRGLGLLVQASGHRSFFWQRKVRGYPRWETLGRFPDLSVENARDAAEKLNHKMAKWKADRYESENPFMSRVEPTLDQLVDEYAEKQIKPHAKNPEVAERRLRRWVEIYMAAWRSRPLGSIRLEEIADLHHRIGEKQNHRRTANVIVKTLRVLFNFAVRSNGFKGENPARGITFYHEPKRERFLQPDELPKLWAALRQSPNQDFRDYVVLALFTGARKADILSMRWSDLSLEDNRWNVPNPKSRHAYVVALSNEATEVLKRRPKTSEWVFPGVGKSGHIVDLKGRWKELLKNAGLDYADGSALRPTQHDLRRTYASWMAARGTSIPIIAKALGHQSTSATQVYSRLSLDPVREAMEAATSSMSKAMKKKPRLLPVAAKRKKAARRG